MRLSWRVRLTIVAAFLITLGTLQQVLLGYEGVAVYLEHLLVALLVCYIAWAIIATIIAWYQLANLTERRRSHQQ
ncbi:MAG: hypothetical protein ACYDHP_02010 [Ferrimicrobium sp.]